MEYSEIKVLLVDGGDRQTLPMAKAFKNLGCYVATLNASKLDNGYSSRYPDEKIVDKHIQNSKAYHIDKIKKLLETGKYDVAVTTSDDTAEGLSLMRNELIGKAEIAVVEPELFYMAYNKNKTMRVCSDNNIPCPKTYFGISSAETVPYSEFVYPLVVKPCKSFGAIGFHKVDNESELKSLTSIIGDNIGQYVFQEYIPQSALQYVCVMFFDEKSTVKSACVFSKNRWFPISGGAGTCYCTVNRPDIIEECTLLMKKIKWHGICDIDLIQDPRDEKIKIIEINPRVSASIKIVLNSGVNIAEQILQLAMGKEVTEHLSYKVDNRMRCCHTDLLWFIKSPDRFHSKPSWFSCKNTTDQIFSISDPVPFFTFSVQALMKYKKEMKKRA